MKSDCKLAQDTMKELGLNEQQYLNMYAELGSDAINAFIVEKEVFFEWCAKNKINCNNGNMYLDAKEFPDGYIKCGEYDYGIHPNIVIVYYQ